MIDGATVAALATAGGTLVLAVATFGSVRSANRAARVGERALLAAIRPVLVGSRLDDPTVKVGFADEHWLKVLGGHAGAEVTDDVIYLAMALRNVGSGLAVLDRWDLRPDQHPGQAGQYRDPATFRRLTRDLYVPSGDVGFWQGALRDGDEPIFAPVRTAIEERQTVAIDLLYGDHDGGQRTITRFHLIPAHDDQWLVSVSRHWSLDRAQPR